MKLFLSIFTGLLLASYSLTAGPNANCPCEDCACTAENSCGCFEGKPCQCENQKGDTAQVTQVEPETQENNS